jgi:hypothetical protein
VLKRPLSRRNERRKNDEDIAERITGGVRVERPPVRRDEQPPVAPNDGEVAQRDAPRGRRTQ